MKKIISIKEIIVGYIKNNLKEYILVCLIFLVGLFAGVMIVNNCSETLLDEVSQYLNDFINNIKDIQKIDKTGIMVQSAKNNLYLGTLIFIAGTTVIGLPVVFGACFYRGLVLGYTIAVITYTFGKVKGIIFCLISILLKNILFIPAVLTITVSSIRLYKSIIKERSKENIKTEIIRHFIISALMILVLIVSAIIKNIISATILQKMIKYF